VTTGFAALLIGFMLYVTFYGDVRRFSIYREMFEDHAQIEQAGQPPNAPAPPANAAPQK
jgi:hypothetical protein